MLEEQIWYRIEKQILDTITKQSNSERDYTEIVEHIWKLLEAEFTSTHSDIRLLQRWNQLCCQPGEQLPHYFDRIELMTTERKLAKIPANDVEIKAVIRS